MASRLRQLAIVVAAGCLLTAGGAGAAGKAPKHLKKPASDSTQAHYTDSGPEPLLAKVFDAIEANRLDLAMQQTDALTKAYPNFRLAHLIRGDLLLARSRPLTSFGEGGSPAAGDKVADLRDEAIVRLKGYRTKPGTDYVPRYLLQMHPEQKHAVVVDTQKSRLYLYQNDKGTPRFVADYYISQGKLGAEKSREGDKKTPIGVYHVTSSLPRQKLTDFYGSGAFPINYPNEWDKRQGRNGHGIWLHGTPSAQYARAPESTDGCVVLSNPEMGRLLQMPELRMTPVIIAATLRIGSIILTEAGLSFLGLGVQPPTPSWGNIINEGRDSLLNHWWISTFPGIAILSTVVCFNLIGDGVRDALDPRMRN